MLDKARPFARARFPFDAALMDSTNQSLRKSRHLLADTAEMVDTKLRWKLVIDRARPAEPAEQQFRSPGKGGRTVKDGDGT